MHRKCLIKNCKSNHQAKGYCKFHYNKFRREGRFDRGV